MTTSGGIFSYSFWSDAAERAIKTFAQTALVAIGLEAGFDVLAGDVDAWLFYLGSGLGGALLSVLTSMATSTRTGTASLVADANQAVARDAT